MGGDEIEGEVQSWQSPSGFFSILLLFVHFLCYFARAPPAWEKEGLIDTHTHTLFLTTQTTTYTYTVL
ncbi:hypothetical protein DM02DRAFT_230155 [Periconia macrospinosa]|uniref:Uncharacterized protein n=1 Tax=Periconia macrospinosa TaxID=97972 RepID=A0A2V1D5J2_9PLEO|nr:hypothetical protein DM02DRAFT_230155 [Periconia macrospinosa]